jgi:DNA-binding PadR family transcriptional regulator
MPYPVDKMFSILLALAVEPASGREIGQKVLADTHASSYMQSSSLNLLLERMRKVMLIEPAEIAPDQADIVFRLTPKGWDVLERGIPQLEHQLQAVRERIDAKRHPETKKPLQ